MGYFFSLFVLFFNENFVFFFKFIFIYLSVPS